MAGRPNASRRPLGSFLFERLAGNHRPLASTLKREHAKLDRSSTVDDCIANICAFSCYVDTNLIAIRDLLGGSVTPFSVFRGSFLEESVIRLAEQVLEHRHGDTDMTIVKFGTGQGVVTGLSLAFRRPELPDEIPILLRRDREDVVIGFSRKLTLQSGNDKIEFDDEVIPVCVIACKMYIDATRLENVLAKAESILAQHATCAFLVASDWDALGREWHDAKGRVLDSLTSPVSKMVFLRGHDARRPQNAVLAQQSLAHPYLPAQLHTLADEIDAAIQDWR